MMSNLPFRTPARPPTLAQIAKQAQVSIAIVSRCLHGSAGHQRILLATRERVRLAAQVFRYGSPSPAVPAGSRLVALVSGGNSHPSWGPFTLKNALPHS